MCFLVVSADMAVPRPKKKTPPRDRDVDLLDATVRLLSRGGLAAVTHRAVAEEAGVSLGSVTYRHLTIDALLEAALLRYCMLEIEQLEALAKLLSAQTFDADAWAGSFARIIAEGTKHPAALAGYELMLDAARRPRLRKSMRETNDAYRRVAQLALAAAGSREPSKHAHVLVAAITGLQLHQLSEPEPNFPRRLEQALREVVTGLVACE